MTKFATSVLWFIVAAGAPGVGFAQLVQAASHQAAATCAELKAGDVVTWEILRNPSLRASYLGRCVALGGPAHIARARRAADIVIHENHRAADFSRPLNAFERALLGRAGASLGEVTTEVDAVVDGLLGKTPSPYGYLAAPRADDLAAALVRWERVALKDFSLGRYALARLVEASYDHCLDVAARIRTLGQRPAESFELVALASMLFACDRERFREVEWGGALEAVPSARVHLERLMAVDALGQADGVLWLPYHLVPFADLETSLLSR